MSRKESQLIMDRAQGLKDTYSVGGTGSGIGTLFLMKIQ